MKKLTPKQKRVLSFMKQHPIAEAFIVSAVEEYADLIIENKEDVKKKMKDSVVHPILWIGAAESWKTWTH